MKQLIKQLFCSHVMAAITINGKFGCDLPDELEILHFECVKCGKQRK